MSSLADTKPWFALQVQALREFVVERLLIQKGYETLLPIHLHTPNGHVRTRLREPLFPGYLFCRIDMLNRTNYVVATPGVTRILGNSAGPVQVPEEELIAVQRIAESGLPLGIDPGPLHGCVAMIVCGSLKGIHGTVIESGNFHKLAISVSMVECSLTVSIDRSWAVRLCSMCREYMTCKRRRPERLVPANIANSHSIKIALKS